MTDTFYVLIVEDDLDIANLIALQVNALKGTAKHCSRLTSAKDVIQSQTIDLLILDLSLPDGDGLAFCRWFRQQDESTPILMLTARSNELDKVIGLELGADDYLSKPFGLAELRARMKALVRRSKRSPISEVIIEVGQLTLNVKTHQAWLYQTLLELTAKEFALLKVFSQNPNQVFSRHDLLTEIWGENHEGYEHTINSHLNRLRKKIEVDPAYPKILETVWGVGYRLNAACLANHWLP